MTTRSQIESSPKLSYIQKKNGWDTWIRTKEMPDSESGALPLGYIPIKNMADSEGLEPSTKRLTAVCSTKLSYKSVNTQHLRVRWKAGYSPRFILRKCCVVNLLKKIVKKKNNDINAIKREVVGSCFLPRAFSPQRVQARLQIRIKYVKPDACL